MSSKKLHCDSCLENGRVHYWLSPPPTLYPSPFPYKEAVSHWRHSKSLLPFTFGLCHVICFHQCMLADLRHRRWHALEAGFPLSHLGKHYRSPASRLAPRGSRGRRKAEEPQLPHTSPGRSKATPPNPEKICFWKSRLSADTEDMCLWLKATKFCVIVWQ